LTPILLYFSKFYLFFQHNKQKGGNHRHDTAKDKWRANTNICPKQSGNKRSKKSDEADCGLINTKGRAGLFLGN